MAGEGAECGWHVPYRRHLHLIGVYLTGVHLIGVYLISVYLITHSSNIVKPKVKTCWNKPCIGQPKSSPGGKMILSA
jgi:hypothetical protein